MQTNAHKIDEIAKLYTNKQIISAGVIVAGTMLGATNENERKVIFDIYLVMLEACLDQAGNMIASVITNEDCKQNIKDT